MGFSETRIFEYCLLFFRKWVCFLRFLEHPCRELPFGFLFSSSFESQFAWSFGFGVGFEFLFALLLLSALTVTFLFLFVAFLSSSLCGDEFVSTSYLQFKLANCYLPFYFESCGFRVFVRRDKGL